MAENPPGDRRDRDDLLDILPEPPSPLIAPANDELRPLPRKKRRAGFLVWFLVFLGAGAAAAGTGWFLLKGGKYGGVGPDGQPPTIRADQRPYKTKPQSPGGMDVPNQDKTVYDRINPKEGGGPGQVESLLPSPEKPQAPPAGAAPAVPATTAGVRPSTPVLPQTTPIEAPPPTPPALPAVPEKPPTARELAAAPPPSAAVKAPSSPAAGKAPPTPAAAPIVKVTPALPAAKATPVAAQPGGAYMVQLGALKEESAAAKEWAKVQKANSDLLGALSLDVQRADLGDKGVFFRMRAGPLADPEAAKALCSALAQRKQGCMVVKK